MPQIDEALTKELLASEPEFKALYDDREKAKRRLKELAQKSFLSETEEQEFKELKLHKLALADRMADIVRDRQASRVSAGS